MTRSARSFVLFSALALFTSAEARAQAPALDLRWQAPAGCPQERAVRERIEQLAGPKKATEGRVGASGLITQTDDGRFHLKLVVRSGGLVGERNIEAKSCEQLAGAAAVALGLLMHSGQPLSSATPLGSDAASQGSDGANPSAAASNQGSRANGGATSASSPSGDPSSSNSDGTGPSPDPGASSSESKDGNPSGSSPHAPSDAAQSSRAWRARVQAPLGALGIGPLPDPSFGLALGGGVSVEDWGFYLHLAKWAQQHLTATDFPGYGADADRFSASLSVCRLFRRDLFEVAPCLVMSVEHLSASGMGERVQSRAQSVTWVAPGVGAQARIYLAEWFALAALVSGQIEASRGQISIAGVGDIARLGPAAVTVLVGPEWIL